jgi:hypothetical protein
MKRILFILGWVILLAAASCFNPPEFSDIPSISIEEVRVKEVAGASTADSLIITIGFTDGDGNIGLDGSEIEPPFNERWFFLLNPIQSCENGVSAPCTKISYVDQSNLNNYITYKLRRTTHPELPEFAQPDDCESYFVLRNTNNQPIDTLYSELNSRYFNLFVDIEVKGSGSVFTKFNFNNAPYPKCDIYGLNGRLPILAKDGDLSVELPLDGVITYKVTSPSLYSTLRNKTIRLRVWLMDRDGNISSEEGTESDEFTIN